MSPEDWEELMEAARRVRSSAYAPYSGYRVGAALEDEEGRIFVGANVENASYPVGMCAEHAALGSAASAGARSFRRLALSVADVAPASPCGRCRQALAEFGTDLEILSEGSREDPDRSRRRWTLGELLPDSFGRRESLEADGDGA